MVMTTPSSTPSSDGGTLTGWFTGRLPDGWFTGPPEVHVDREEILVVGCLPEPDTAGLDAPARAAAHQARIAGFREDTRAERMRVADAAEAEFGRKVAWGAVCGEERTVFTALSVPVMTRLRMPERRGRGGGGGGGGATPWSTPAWPAAAVRRWRGACSSCATTRATGSRSCGLPWSTSSRSGPRVPRRGAAAADPG